MRLIALLVACFFLVFAASAVGQTGAGGMELTLQQQRMLDALPAGERAQVLRQIRALQESQQGALSDPFARTQDGAETEDEEDAEPSDEGLERGTIRADDTLIIEVKFPPRDPKELGTIESLVPRTHLLEGRHVVQLDGTGQLSMPGINDVRLAGLNAKQAELRLMAEPVFDEMVVAVTRLTLEPIGREALKPFGYDIFRSAGRQRESTGQPVAAGVPADYVVGPGDSFQMFLFGKDGGSINLVVNREGLLEVPNLGPVEVAGLTYSAAKELLERRIREETIGTQASVSMGQLRAIEVLIVGEVEQPGQRTIGSLSTVITALYAAGGITEVGTLRDIRVLRGGGVHATLDLYDLLLRGDASGDLRLQSGDIVFVPPTGPRAGVTGAALREAWFELDDDSTIGALLDFAGNQPNADLGRVQLQRQDRDGDLRFVDVDATTAEGRATRVSAGDLVTVPRAAQIARNALTVRGHFARSGLREWKEGIRIGDLLRGGAALRPNPDLDFGLVLRQLADGRGIKVEMFTPRAVIDNPDSPENKVLNPRDTVIVFGFDDPIARQALMQPVIEQLRAQASRGAPARIAQVSGAVRVPGFYPLAEGMRMADLARAGGGLDESAYGGAAEVTRSDIGGNDARLITHVEIDLEKALAGDPTHDLLVQSHDVLNIKTVPQWEQRGTIELKGEVRFPGIYPIRPGETLSAIIERAGGLTEFAYPNASVFTRESLREREQQQLEHMIRRLEADVAAAAAQGGVGGTQAQAMGSALVSQLRNTQAVGRLVIDLERLIRSPNDPDYDVLAMDGDLLAIPSRPQEVTVLGEVNFTTSHVYTPDADRNDYIDSSGGLTARADKGRIYIVRANGAVEGAGGRRAKDIMPGDTIVVPLDADRLPPMVRVMNISQILYQLALAAAAWNSLGVL